MRGETYDVVTGPSRMGPVAASLMLAALLLAAGSGSVFAEIYSPNEGTSGGDLCSRPLTRCVNDCRNGNTLPIGSSPSAIKACDNGCDSDYAKCVRKFGPGKSSGGQQRPLGATPPKSNTPTKPQGPGSVGTPPKSNPTTGVKPRGPGSVGSPPKSNSSSGGGGTILRSGNSGNSNSNNSGGGGNSGGSKR
jgi:hypothetical protein